ncbi:Zn-dependent hydrolase [Gracilibacillus sp. D59]|uniref:Zn-dependent hydrolase n=1 Tax=Gracilibacillus sp. D59 TaxID=3457434 RepID=UPI003FCC7E40
MKKLTLDSEEFKRIIHNLHIEQLHLDEKRQKQILSLVNSGMKITPSVLKEAWKNG